MGHRQDLTAAGDAAWAAFRGRLADHVAAMRDDEVLIVDYADAVDADRMVGAAPYVQVCAFGDGWLRVEAVSNTYLDPSVALDAAQESLLLDLGWRPPGGEAGEHNFHDTVEQREADRVAVLLVRTLREVHGVPHPAFLAAGGLEVDPDHRVAAAGEATDVDVVVAADDDGAGQDAVEFALDADHLQSMVDEAMRAVFPALRHDSDGDIPIIAGQSLAFVRVLPDRPAVELYAEIVVDPTDLDRLPLELELLNRGNPLWKFVRGDEVVVMRHEIVAIPFSGHQLRQVTRRFVDEVDAIAGDLVARVGGRRFRDPVEEDPRLLTPTGSTGCDCRASVDPDLAITGLLELCHLGRPRAATVAGLFEHDRGEIIRQIVRIRTGQQSCDGHDVDDVLHVLRKALRLVSDGEPRPDPGLPGPRSIQPSLLSDDDLGEAALDLQWPA